MITTSQMRLDESHNLSWMRLAKSHDSIVSKTNQDIGSGIRPVCKLAKSLIEISSKVHKPKTFNKVIDDIILGNK